MIHDLTHASTDALRERLEEVTEKWNRETLGKPFPFSRERSHVAARYGRTRAAIITELMRRAEA